MNTENEKILSVKEAYKSMFFFLRGYYHQTSGNAILSDVMGDIQFWSGEPADPAMWGDWLCAVDHALAAPDSELEMKLTRPPSSAGSGGGEVK